MGAQRRAHHQRVEAERAASAEADRIQAIMQQSERNMMRMAQAVKPPEVMAPTNVASTMGARGISTGRSARKTARKTAQGVAGLRIPLNVGESSTSGLNIG